MKYNDFWGKNCNGVLLKCLLFVWNATMSFHYNHINIWAGLLKKKSIFTHLYLQVLEEELKQKKKHESNNIAFTTSCLVNIQSFCLYNKLQTDSDWLGSHNIIIEKTDLINSIVGINQ